MFPVDSSSYRLKERGFTLIELIMIIVLISIMAAVAVPKFGNYYNGITLGSVVTIQELCTSASAILGAEVGESRATYDDIDDFNGIDNTPPIDSQGN